jgi:threonine/homoserine/homoserine lactone efflux protein
VISALLGGIVAGFAIAIPVGAISVLIHVAAARHGWRAGAAAGLGTATVDGAYAAVAVLLGAGLAPWIREIGVPLKWASVVVLVVVAALVVRPAFARATAQPHEAPVQRLTPGRAYLRVLGLTAVNPATVIYFAALVAGSPFGAVTAPALGIAFVCGVLAASASWQLVVATAGAGLGKFLTGPRGRRWTAIVGGALILLLALRTALSL